MYAKKSIDEKKKIKGRGTTVAKKAEIAKIKEKAEKA